ncbi:hypothetical protein I4U23_014998 [Adineta vaga]|nr:hypothetical protein I4U23_014998 [Adineta vaga]
MSTLLNVMRDNSIRRPIAPHGFAHHQHKSLEQPQYGQQEQPRSQSSYGSSLISIPKTLPSQGYGQINQGYGAAPRMLAFDQPQEVQQIPIVTEADNLCRGKAPETIIPLDEGRRFVVCLDDGKGTEQFCPKGLFYQLSTQRCERKYGPQNYCASQPCLNGGQCIPTDSSYQCQCTAGFDGQTCELDARICQTQYPCGQSSDARCQSFRLGAALSYICIFQDGFAYGLGAQQTVASPCQGVDGPHALAVSDKGFIMCDGERMFVESCPGGTIWEDSSKACVWPDMQVTAPQLDQSYSYGSYGQSRQLIKKPSYGGSFEQPKTLQGYGSFEQPKTLQGYGSFEQPKTLQGYGSFEQPKTLQGYGSQILSRPIFEQPKFNQGYGSQILPRPVPEQPRFNQGYGSQIPIQPVPEQPKFNQAYGSQITIQPLPEQPKLTQGYGSQIDIQPLPEQPKLVQSAGY